MLISLLLLQPDTCQSEEVSCRVSRHPTPKCAIMVPLSHQELCCSSDGHRGSSSGCKDSPVGREGANSCFAFPPLAKFNISGFILIKPDPGPYLGLFFKLEASQSSLGTTALSESGCYHRGFCKCSRAFLATCFCCCLKPQGL